MGKVSIKNVLVFDGEVVRGPETVIIDGELIGTDATNATAIDGTGCMILPGLIDSHVHISSEDDLRQHAKYGVTTVCDLGAYPKETFEKMKSVKGTTTYYSSGLAAFPVGGLHDQQYPGASVALKSEDDVPSWIQARLAEGVDFIKIIVDEPGFDQPTLEKLVAKAKAYDKLVICHTNTFSGYERCLAAGADILTHTPWDKPVDQALAEKIAAQGVVASATLAMAKLVISMKVHLPETANFADSLESVRVMYKAGVTMLVGTDGNSFIHNPHGESLHQELELMVEAGMIPIDALRGATSAAAKHFRLGDIGKIAPGFKADLVLIEGDPTKFIADTRKIRRVWKDGVELL